MYQLPKLAKTPGLAHGFSTREEGNQGFGFGPKVEVIRNRGRFIRQVSDTFVITSGVGMVPFYAGNEIVAVVGPTQAGRGIAESNSGPRCEALITVSDAPPDPSGWFLRVDLYLFLAIGDCFPIILYAGRAAKPGRRVLALVHASRESTLCGVAGKTVDLMVSYFGVKPEDIVAGIGPGIQQDSYCLQEFPPAAVAGSSWQPFCRMSDGGVLVDLAGHNVALLRSRGVPAEQIEVSPIDTFTDTSFFSHRRSKATGEPEGRHAVAVGMVPVE